MGKSLKRYHNVDSGELLDRKVKVLKRRKMNRKMALLKNDDYLDDEEMSRYVNDPRIYRAIKEYN